MTLITLKVIRVSLAVSVLHGVIKVMKCTHAHSAAAAAAADRQTDRQRLSGQ